MASVTGLSMSSLLITSKKPRMKQEIALMSFLNGGLREFGYYYYYYTPLSDTNKIL